MSGSLNRYKIINNKLYNCKMKSYPSFLHYQGNSLSFYNFHMKPLGYKEIDIKAELLPIKSKKIKEIFDIYQEFCWQNIFQIYNNLSNKDNKFYRKILTLTLFFIFILSIKLIN